MGLLKLLKFDDKGPEIGTCAGEVREFEN